MGVRGRTDEARRGRRTPPPCHSGSRGGRSARGGRKPMGAGHAARARARDISAAASVAPSSAMGAGHTRRDACPDRHNGAWEAPLAHFRRVERVSRTLTRLRAGPVRWETGLGHAPVPAAFAEHTAASAPELREDIYPAVRRRWPPEYRGGLRTASNFGFR